MRPPPTGMDPVGPLRYPPTVQNFQVVHKNALPHGIVAGVVLPGTADPVPEEILARLDPSEQALARALKGFRQAEFVGGRLAAQSAILGLGRPPGPVGAAPRGEPLPPAGITLSISHKRHLAVAMAARADFGALGIDLEALEPPREGIASKVLVPSEREAVQALPEDRRWTGTVVRFAIKEAIYKALAPRLQRYIAFDEAVVIPDTDGTAAVTLQLSAGDAPRHIEARYCWLDRAVLATVRACW